MPRPAAAELRKCDGEEGKKAHAVSLQKEQTRIKQKPNAASMAV